MTMMPGSVGQLSAVTEHQRPHTDLVVVLEQLDDHFDVCVVVFDGDDPHDVRRVLGIRVLAILVRQNQYGVGFFYLQTKLDDQISSFCFRIG